MPSNRGISLRGFIDVDAMMRAGDAGSDFSAGPADANAKRAQPTMPIAPRMPSRRADDSADGASAHTIALESTKPQTDHVRAHIGPVHELIRSRNGRRW